MAAVFDLDDQRVSATDLDAAFGLILDNIRTLPSRSAVRQLRRYRGSLSALEAELLAEFITADGNTKAAERLLGDGKTSRREQRRLASRANAVATNPALGDKLATGEMSDEQVDVIAGAAANSDGAAARDADLIDQVAAVSPEQGTKLVDAWEAERATAADTQTEHVRQRALRRTSNYTNKAGLDAITLEGDGVSIRNMRDAIAERSDLLYSLGGGRDVPGGQHSRTKAQRDFDAAHELICDVTTNADGTTTHQPRGTKPDSNQDAASQQGGTTSKRTTASKPKKTCGCSPRAKASSRPKIVINLPLDKATGKNPQLVAEQIGHGPIPDSVLAHYIDSGDLIGAVFGVDSEVLWLGRTARIAPKQQLLALIIRDKSCVLCSASHAQCEAHHLMPWSAPGHGPTDLNNLALVCRSCHRRLHNNNQTLYRQRSSGVWKLRPATPDETPPPQPKRREPPQRE